MLNTATALVVCGAVGCGAAAGYFTDKYISDTVQARQAALEAEYEPVRALVAKSDMRKGDLLGYSNLAVRSVPAGYVHADAIEPDDAESLIGHRLVHPVNSGETVLLSHISEVRGAGFSTLIKNGLRALTFQVDVVSSLSGLLRPGDRIDLLATVRDRNETVTFTLMDNVQVIATGKKVDEFEREDASGRFQTISLLVGPEDAARIVQAREVGELTVTLRSPGDSAAVSKKRINLDSLLGRTKAPAKPRRARRPRVEIIIGGRT